MSGRESDGGIVYSGTPAAPRRPIGDDEVPPVDTFLHVADLHFWRLVWNPLHLLNKRVVGNLNVLLRRRHQFPLERAERHIAALEAAQSDTVLFTGDFTSTSTDEEFAMAREFVDEVRAKGMKTLVMPGNHDVYTFAAARHERFERHFRDLLPADGFPSSEILLGGTPVILVPTVRPNWLSSSGLVTAAAIDDTAALVRRCEGPCVVAAHYPVLERTYGYKLSPSRQLRNGQALRDALGRTGQKILYVCGHTHEFSYVEDPGYANLRHLTTGPLFRNDGQRNCQGEFCEVHVFEDGFRVVRHARYGYWTRTVVKPRPAHNIFDGSAD